MYYGASFYESFQGAFRLGDTEYILEYGRVSSEEAAVDSVLDVLRLKDNVAIVEPDVRALNRRCIVLVYALSFRGSVGVHVERDA